MPHAADSSSPVGNGNWLLYFGGFAPLGGCEALGRDLLLGLGERLGKRRIAVWGDSPDRIALLGEISSDGVDVIRTPLKHGCRWAVPDRLLLRFALRAAREADLLVFVKLFPERVRRAIRRSALRDGKPVPSILITPYRPAEMWPDGGPAPLLNVFDAVTVQAGVFAQDLGRLGYRGRVEVIPLIPPPATPINPLPPVSPGAPIRLGFLGRIEAQKNLGYALKTLAMLKDHEAPFELHLFGDGSLRSSLEFSTAELGLADRVTFHGAVPRGRVRQAVDSCHLFVNPSVTEGQCIAAMEILSRGRPLVATPVGALPELIDHSDLGELVPLNEPDAFAAALVRQGDRVRGGHVDPSAISLRFNQRYGREAILDAYARLFESMRLKTQ